MHNLSLFLSYLGFVQSRAPRLLPFGVDDVSLYPFELTEIYLCLGHSEGIPGRCSHSSHILSALSALIMCRFISHSDTVQVFCNQPTPVPLRPALCVREGGGEMGR